MMRRFKHGSTVLSFAFVTGAALAFATRRPRNAGRTRAAESVCPLGAARAHP
jgi:hypothetical protein